MTLPGLSAVLLAIAGLSGCLRDPNVSDPVRARPHIALPPPAADEARAQNAGPPPTTAAPGTTVGPGDTASEPEPPSEEAEPVLYPFHEPMPPSSLAREASARRHADLSPAGCRKELGKTAIGVKPMKGYAKGVANPMRLDGAIHGVRFVAPHAPSPYGVLDCRLALALGDMAKALAPLGVVEVRVDNMYRPSARLAGRGKRSQHAYGLAIDVLSFKLDDGRVLDVERDWHAPVGSSICGTDAVMEEPTDEAIRLRTIVCALAREGIFHHMLTPSFNAAHRNHFHFDIKRDEKSWGAH